MTPFRPEPDIRSDEGYPAGVSPATFRILAGCGVVAQLAHVVSFAALARGIHRALGYAGEAVHGDISRVTQALGAALPTIRITGPVGFAGFVLLLFAVMKGGARARWIFWPGLLASFFYALSPFIVLLAGVRSLPLGLIPGFIGLVHFLGHRREYRSSGQSPVEAVKSQDMTAS
ncbi:MAG TPA: hypothetical protein VHO24_07565 [Opitutaceae bacterium]|nr:hypothetical protein [Opitutaceae bacterium]